MALGCDCVGLSVNEAKKAAEVVFRGTIIDVSAGKVIFRVDRVWKGNVRPTFDMPEFIEGAACLGFHERMLKVGSDLLVYATRLHRSSTTKIISRASALGRIFRAMQATT